MPFRDPAHRYVTLHREESDAVKFYSCPEPHDTQGLTLYSLSSGTQLFSSIFTAAMFTPAIFFTPAMFTPAMLKLHGHPLSEFLKKQNADLMLGVVPRVTESRTLELTNSQIPPAPAELGYSFRGWRGQKDAPCEPSEQALPWQADFGRPEGVPLARGHTAAQQPCQHPHLQLLQPSNTSFISHLPSLICFFTFA